MAVLDGLSAISFIDNMPDLERALTIAIQAHAGQKDKNGEAYIFHPIRVMTRCKSPVAKIAALLHDVVEDTDYTFDQLAKEGFSTEVIDVVKLLTHEKEVPYDNYIDAIATHPTAIEVKLADLEDNSDIRRLKKLDAKSAERLQKYLGAYQRLTEGPRSKHQ